MFFNKLKREIVALNLVNLMFFVTVFSYLRFSSDLYMNGMAFSVIRQMKPVVYPFSFFYFVLSGVILSHAICRLFNLQCRTKHYFMIFASGILYAFFYLGLFIVVYALYNEALATFAKYALTELSFWIITVVAFSLLVILLKILTLSKIMVRLYFFSMTDGGGTEHYWIRSAFSEMKNKAVYVRFLLSVAVSAGIPLILCLAGMAMSNLIISVLAILSAIFFYSTGKLACIFLLWKNIFSDVETEEASEEIVEA